MVLFKMCLTDVFYLSVVLSIILSLSIYLYLKSLTLQAASISHTCILVTSCIVFFLLLLFKAEYCNCNCRDLTEICLCGCQVGGEMSSRYSIKALTVCTASIPQACEELVKLDKREF